MFPFAQSGGAKPIAAMGTDAGRLASAWGGLEGGTPPHRFKARTAAFDGHNAFTRAARSAGLNFAVILLSKAMNVGRDHLIHRKRSPFPYVGKDLTRRKVGWTYTVGRDTTNARRAKRCRAGRAKPIAGRGGLEGVPLRTDSRRGQRLSTDTMPSPAPARSAGLRFAVILLSKTMDVGRDHLIHRKRSPFPYVGKDLTRRKVGWTYTVGRDTSQLRRAKRCRADRAKPFAGRGGLEGGTPPHI